MTAPVRNPNPEAPPTLWVDLLAISVVCVVVYSNTLDAPFVFDDLSSIVYNRHIRVDAIRFDALATAAFESPVRRPVANLSFALNHAFGGYDVRSYHVVNLGIHLATGLVVYLLASALFARLRPGARSSVGNLSLLAALVFVTHPIQTQAVTYVVQRMTSMATLFYLLAVLAYLEGRSCDAGRRRWAWWAATGVSGVLAFGTKQIAITLPVALLLVEWCFFRDASWDWLRQRVWLLLGLLVSFAVVGSAYLAGIDPLLPSYAGQDFTMGERVLTQLRVVVFYLSLLVFPHPARLNLTHPFAVSHSLLDPVSTLLAGAFLMALVTLAFALRRRERLLSFAVLWFFLHLLVESSILPLALVFEHRLYLPMFGFALLTADLIWRLSRGRPVPLIAIGTAVVVALGCATFLRNAVWGDAIVFWSDVVAKSPLDDRAHYNLALAYQSAGSLEDTERQYEKVLRLNPSYAGAVNGLGMIYEGRGDDQRALELYAEAARLEPDVPIYPTNLALLLAQEGKLEEADRGLEVVVHSHPDYAKGHYSLGTVRELAGRIEDAKRSYRETLRVESDYADAHVRLAALWAREGNVAEALRHAGEAARLNPDRPESRRIFEALRQAAGRSQ